MMTRGYQGWFGTAPPGRRNALLLVLLAHVGALLWVQTARTVRPAHPVEQWIDLVTLAEPGRQARPPALPAASAPAVSAPRANAEVARQLSAAPAQPVRTQDAASTAADAAPPASASPVPADAAARPSTDHADAVPQGAAAPAPGAASLTARALAAAGAADRAERNGKAPPLSAAPSQRQKLAAAIEAATAGPRLWQAPRITQLKDNTGYGRQIYKVETGLSTYCIVAESNHALDGRDVIRDGIHQKTVSCPIEF